MSDDTLEAARRAKAKAHAIFSGFGAVCGVGLTMANGVHAVKVNLETAPEDASSMPDSIDGIPVVVCVVGRIRRQSGEQ